MRDTKRIRLGWIWILTGIAVVIGAAGWKLWAIRQEVLLSAGLLAAVKARDLARVEHLLRLGADPDATQEVQTWSSDSIVELIRSVFRSQPKKKGDWPALRLAINGGDVEIAKLLLKHGAAVVNTKGRSISERRETLLMSSIYLGDVDLVKMLLDRGADVHARDWIRSTPAHYAIYSGSPRILDLLLSRGADPEAADEQNRTLLQGAAGSRKGHEMIQILLQWKADPNRKGQAGWLPLHVAAMLGKEESVRALVSAGSQVNAKSKYGVTPLQSALKRKRTEVVRILKDAGAK